MEIVNREPNQPKPEYSVLGRIDHPQFLEYPTECTVGIFNSPEETAEVIKDFVRRGFSEKDMKVLEGESGRLALDLDGNYHSVIPKIKRVVEKFLDTGDWDLIVKADEHLKEGRVVLSLSTPTEMKKDEAIEVMQEHGGRYIKYFSRYYVEHIDEK